jgi:hypothetical protein
MEVNISTRAPGGRNNESESEDSVGERRQPNWRWWRCGAVLTTALVIVSMLSPYGRHEWAVSLGHEPTSYTELSFKNAAALPTTALRGKAVRVSFEVTNSSSGPVTYQYLIASGSAAKLKTLGSGSRTVAANTSWVVSRLVVPSCPGSTCRVAVSLPQQSEIIDFVLAVKPTARRITKSNNLVCAGYI